MILYGEKNLNVEIWNNFCECFSFFFKSLHHSSLRFLSSSKVNFTTESFSIRRLRWIANITWISGKLLKLEAESEYPCPRIRAEWKKQSSELICAFYDYFLFLTLFLNYYLFFDSMHSWKYVQYVHTNLFSY